MEWSWTSGEEECDSPLGDEGSAAGAAGASAGATAGSAEAVRQAARASYPLLLRLVADCSGASLGTHSAEPPGPCQVQLEGPGPACHSH